MLPPSAPSRRRLTLWIPVGVSAFVQVTAALWLIRVVAPPPSVAAVTFALALVGPVALVGARRLPGPVVAAATAATVVQLLVSVNGGPPPVALAFAVVLAVVRGARVWAWVSLAVGWLLALVIVVLVPPLGWSPPRIIATTFGLVLLLGAGEFVRARRERIRETEEELSRRRAAAAEEERARIARELHDVLAHSLSQISVQAGVGLHLGESDPARATEALASIRATSKRALDDLRGVLGALRDGGDAPLAPQPGLAEIPALVDAVRIPGAVVRLEDLTAGAAVPAPVGAAVYRIVQEALTNAARHARGATRVDVALDAAAGWMRIRVHDDGAVDPEPVAGRGLAGMRERCEHLGGTFSWRAAADGFTIDALIPWEASA